MDGTIVGTYSVENGAPLWTTASKLPASLRGRSRGCGVQRPLGHGAMSP